MFCQVMWEVVGDGMGSERFLNNVLAAWWSAATLPEESEVESTTGEGKGREGGSDQIMQVDESD